MLEGTVHTPLGTVSKKTAVLGGGAIVAIAAIVYVRSKNASKAADAAAAAATAGANTGIDPSTGYAYGSAEDAAALAAQGSYITPVTSSDGIFGGGGSIPTSTTPGPGGFTSNAQWAQYVEQTLVANDQVQDATALSAAIGKYLTGQPVNTDQQSLIQQAIAFGGLPPQSGSAGYPPSINTTPSSTPTATVPGTVTGLSGGQKSSTGVLLYWNATAGATSYKLYGYPSGDLLLSNMTGTAIWVNGMRHGGKYTYQVAAVNSAGEGPKSSPVTVSPL